MRASQLKQYESYALETRNGISQCYVLENKGWKANRQAYGYRGQQRPTRVAGAGGTAVLVMEYSSWKPRVVNCTKILRTWAEHSAAMQEAQERQRRQRLAQERARAVREELVPFVNAALAGRGMRGRAASYTDTVSVSFSDLLTLLGGEAAIREEVGEVVRVQLEAEATRRAEEARQRAAREAAQEAERQAAAVRRQAELEAERTAGPMASELVAGEVQ
jgi:hypothetical protein